MGNLLSGRKKQIVYAKYVHHLRTVCPNLSRPDWDVYIYAEDQGVGWCFPAHSRILRNHSHVFQDVFAGQTGVELHVDETVPPDTVRRMLEWVYVGNLDFNHWEEAVDLLMASDTYGLRPLVDKCTSFLSSRIPLRDVCRVYDEALIRPCRPLADVCLRLMLRAGPIVLMSDGFSNLSTPAAKKLISHSELNVTNDYYIHLAIMIWAEAECFRTNQSPGEGKIFHKINLLFDRLRLDPTNSAGHIMEQIDESLQKSLGLLQRRPLDLCNPPVELIGLSEKILVEGLLHNSVSLAGNQNTECLVVTPSCPVFLVGFKVAVRCPRNAGFVPLEVKVSMSDATLTVGRVQNWCVQDIFENTSLREGTVCFPVPFHLSQRKEYRTVVRLEKTSDTSVTPVWVPQVEMQQDVLKDDMDNDVLQMKENTVFAIRAIFFVRMGRVATELFA